MKIKNMAIIGLTLFLLSCGNKYPLENLSDDKKEFLFGADGVEIAFMGLPIDDKTLSCNARYMAQGYIFNENEDGISLKSIRPSSVEHHIVSSISSNDDSIDIIAKNAANIPFKLFITDINEEGASISFGGEHKSEFIRCEK